jgi:hypothetical protein
MASILDRTQRRHMLRINRKKMMPDWSYHVGNCHCNLHTKQMCVITTNARDLLHLHPGMATVLHEFYATDHKARLYFVNWYLTGGICWKN